MFERFTELEKRRIFPGLKSYLWKLSGLIGRTFFNRTPPDIVDPDGFRLLNLGCGEKHIKGWVNADFYRVHNLLWKRSYLPDWMIDLTHKLNCDDNYWDGILLEHVNEHLLYSQNHKLFIEVYKKMRPGATIRVAIPDLDRYLDWNTLKDKEPKMARYHSLPEAVSNLTQNHSHIAIWNFDLLSETLVDCGFKNVTRVEFGESSFKPMVNVDSKGHKWESCYVEATK